MLVVAAIGRASNSGGINFRVYRSGSSSIVGHRDRRRVSSRVCGSSRRSSGRIVGIVSSERGRSVGSRGHRSSGSHGDRFKTILYTISTSLKETACNTAVRSDELLNLLFVVDDALHLFDHVNQRFVAFILLAEPLNVGGDG